METTYVEFHLQIDIEKVLSKYILPNRKKLKLSSSSDLWLCYYTATATICITSHSIVQWQNKLCPSLKVVFVMAILKV